MQKSADRVGEQLAIIRLGCSRNSEVRQLPDLASAQDH